jgi:hypothetical protein
MMQKMAQTGLTYTVTGNTNASLLTATITGSTNLTLDYLADQFGSADITVQAEDSEGETVETTFTVTVNPVNDPPTWNTSYGGSIINEDAGPQSVGGVVTSSVGPANESSQLITSFIVTTDNTALFSVQPAVSAATNLLTYTLADDANGSCNDHNPRGR